MNTNDYKWLIQSNSFASISPEEDKAGWNEIHKDYSQTTFSLTQEPKVCETLVRPSRQFPCFDIPDSPEIKVLIPGCGSEIYLQKTLLEFCPRIGQICCTDFSKTAIEKANENWQQVNGDSGLKSQQLIFAEIDSTKLTKQKPDWKDKFDYILVVNSILSDEDEQNRQILSELYKVLKPGGKLYGFFPTIFCNLEIAYLNKSKAHWLADGTINLPNSACYYKEFKGRQIYYTPLRLNRIFKEVGFKQLSFEIVFNDSDILASHFKEIQNIDDDPDIYNWEFLVRLEK